MECYLLYSASPNTGGVWSRGAALCVRSEVPAYCLQSQNQALWKLSPVYSGCVFPWDIFVPNWVLRRSQILTENSICDSIAFTAKKGIEAMPMEGAH